MGIRIDLDTPEKLKKTKRTLLLVELMVEVYPWSDDEMRMLIHAIRDDEVNVQDWLREVNRC